MSLTAPLLPAAHALGTGTSEIIVAYASGPADIPKAWDGLQLPHLQALLATLMPTSSNAACVSASIRALSGLASARALLASLSNIQVTRRLCGKRS